MSVQATGERLAWRTASGRSGARHRLRRLALDVLSPQRPDLVVVGVVTVVLVAAAALLSPDLAPESASSWAAWLAANAAGAAVFLLGVAVLARTSRSWAFGTGWRWSTGAALAAGYLAAALAGAVSRSLVGAWLGDPGDEQPLRAGVAPAVLTYLVVAVTANGVIGLLRRVTARERALQQQVAELDRARKLLTQADERVRRDVAEVLYGPVQGRLLAARLRLDRVRADLPPGFATLAELDAAIAMLDDIRDHDVRVASNQLFPPTIRVGLQAALRTLADEFAEAYGVAVELTIADELQRLDEPGASRFHEALNVVLYRAMAEALANAHLHGGATSVQARLDLVPGPALRLVVDDDGAGLRPGPLQMHLGLTSVAARVEHRNGTWSLADRPEGGVRFEAVVPFREGDAGDGRARGARPAAGADRRQGPADRRTGGRA